MYFNSLSPADLHRLVLDAFHPLPKEPLVVFDIDSTIMHTGYRNRRILTEAAGQWPELTSFTANLDVDILGWSITDLLRERGLTSEERLAGVETFWRAVSLPMSTSPRTNRIRWCGNLSSSSPRRDIGSSTLPDGMPRGCRPVPVEALSRIRYLMESFSSNRRKRCRTSLSRKRR